MAPRTRHAYGRRRHRFGELHLPDPAAGERLPVVVLVHGGFWRARYGLDLMDGLAADLTARGLAAWNLEYRRVRWRSRGGVPGTLEDVAAGIDHLATLAHPRLDLTRVVAVGHSAGGHLALWAAGRPDPVVPLAGAVGQAAVSDLIAAEAANLGDGIVRRFTGGTPATAPEAYALASPAQRLPAGVPQLLVHGTEDDDVPVAMSVAYAEAARAAGDDVTLRVRDGEGHFEHLDPASGAWADVVVWMQDLLAREPRTPDRPVPA